MSSTALTQFTTKNESNYSGDMHKLHSGGIDRAIRCNRVISVAIAGLPAGTKCPFGCCLP